MSASFPNLAGSLTALATPFEGSSIDWTALARLADRQIDWGTAALIVCSS